MDPIRVMLQVKGKEHICFPCRMFFDTNISLFCISVFYLCSSNLRTINVAEKMTKGVQVHLFRENATEYISGARSVNYICDRITVGYNLCKLENK